MQANHATPVRGNPLRESPVLLATKVQPPRLRSALIGRPRLVGLASEVMVKRLTVIKAPAGFGKTSLALTWLDPLREAGAQVGWLALDAEDDEPARFFHHVAQALRNACPGVGLATMSLAADASLVPVRAFVSILINELVDVEDDVCLFFDDFHLIADADIQAAVAYFVEHVPSHVHIVVCARTAPPLPLGRLRASNEVLEIDAATLRFDFDETRAFVLSECPGVRSAHDVRQLYTSTEGWAAALRISASMLSHGAMLAAVEPAIPSGASRPFAAYLEELLISLPEAMVAFMLRTSILDALNAPLCEAVTGLKTAHPMLEAIVGYQVLLEPTDSDGTRFRYHRLMAEYLSRRLATEHPAEVQTLHRRAYEWYAAHEDWTEAVKHAIAAGATEDAVALMGQCAKRLIANGDLLTLLGWQRQFPAELLKRHVRVALAIAWGMALAMRFDDARAALAGIEAEPNVAPDAALQRLKWECNAIRAVIAALEDRPQCALDIANDCLSTPSSSAWAVNVLSNVVRFAHWKAGDLEAFHATSWIPPTSDGDQRHAFNSVYRLCLLGHTEMQQVRFELAERHFDDAMRLAEQVKGPQSTSAALCAPMMAQLRYERGDIDGAEALVVDHMPIIDSAVLLDSVLVAYRLLVRIAFTRGQFAHAYALLDRAQAIGHARRWHRLVAGVLVERTRLYLAEGRVIEAAGCVTQFDVLGAPSQDANRPVMADTETYRALATAFLAIARQQPHSVINLLRDALASVDKRRNDYLALRVRVVLAMALHDSGERAQSAEAFREALTRAQAAGIYRSMLDQGPAIVPLLQAVREPMRHSPQEADMLAYVNRLLDGFGAPAGREATSRRVAVRESLSARERRIVALIAQGQSNKEIARTLGIAPETVKSHVKSVFTKLEVDRRAHAVMRAQALGLVADA